MVFDTKLSTGGRVGAIRGSIFEHHFSKILTQLGFVVVKHSEVKDFLKHDGSIEVDEKLLKKLKISVSCEKPCQKIVVWKYRLPPYNFSEIDFYIPYAKIGFWVSYIGRIRRKTCPKCFPEDKIAKFDEFIQSKGVCPHCKKGNLPNRKEGGVERWTCKICGHLVDPLTLKSIECSKCGSKLVDIEDRSASTQAHKQFYYRLAEVLDIKTSSEISCIFVAYNTRKEWRIWHKAFENFFDSAIFVFDPIPFKGARKLMGIFDSEKFNLQFSTLISKVLKKKPAINDQRIKTMFNLMKKIREDKEKDLATWRKSISDSRKLLINSDEVKCYPIRYSIYYLLKQLRKLYPPILPERKYKPDIVIDEKIQKERELLIISSVDDLRNENSEDIWLNSQKSILKLVLINYFDRARKNRWYKNQMLLNLDYEAINFTPFLEQFEPLEELLFIKLNQTKESEEIIEKIENEPCFDVEETTIIKKLLNKDETRGFIIGNDAVVTLKNGKKVVFQCKTSCSFKEWKVSNTIASSGISYKDAKRMIGHNFLASFDIDNDGNIFKKDRVLIAVLDGHWGAGEKNELKNLEMMYLLGVDEIFFADEIFLEDILPERRQFTNFLRKISKNSK